MERRFEIPVLLVFHPEIDVTLALKTIESTQADQPVTFTRAITVARGAGMIVACGCGVELGWISPASLARLSASLGRYVVAEASFQQPLMFGSMIKVRLVRRAQRSGSSTVLDLALRQVCALPTADTHQDLGQQASE